MSFSTAWVSLLLLASTILYPAASASAAANSVFSGPACASAFDEADTDPVPAATSAVPAASSSSGPSPAALRAARNVFELPDFASVPIQVKQRAALRVLAAIPVSLVGPELRDVAERKIQGYDSSLDSLPLRKAMLAAGHEKTEQSALELVLSTFKSVEYDDIPLRVAAIHSLGRLASSGASTIEALLPIARGVDTLGYPEFQAADQSIQAIHKRLGDHAPDFLLSERNWARFEGSHSSSRRDLLKDATVTDVRNLSGSNANATLLVTLKLKNGTQVRGIFKPLSGEGTADSHDPAKVLFTREVQAYDFYREFVHHAHLEIPETLEASVRFGDNSYGVGSFQLFAENKQTLNAFYMGGNPVPDFSEYWKVWDKQRQDPRWAELAPWIRVFDWMMGNTDRFPNSRYGSGNPNNIMMKPDMNGALDVALIDNGNGRRERPAGQFTNPQWDLPAPSEMSPELLRFILSFDEVKLERIRKRYADSVGLQGTNDIVNRIRTAQNYVIDAAEASGDMDFLRSVRDSVFPPTIANRTFKITPGEFARRLSRVRARISDQEMASGARRSLRYADDGLDEIKSLGDRLNAIRGQLSPAEADALTTELNMLKKVYSVDARVFDGPKFLMVKRLPNAEPLANLRMYTPAERAARTVTISGGLVLDATGKPVTTEDGRITLFVLDGEGRLLLTRENLSNDPRSRVKHASLTGGGAVAAAGEIVIRDGKIVTINDSSGNYRPPRAAMQQLVNWFQSNGITLDPSQIQVQTPEETSARPAA